MWCVNGEWNNFALLITWDDSISDRSSYIAYITIFLRVMKVAIIFMCNANKSKWTERHVCSCISEVPFDRENCWKNELSSIEAKEFGYLYWFLAQKRYEVRGYFSAALPPCHPRGLLLNHLQDLGFNCATTKFREEK